MRISDWSSDVCSSDLLARGAASCAFGSLLRQQAIDPPRSRHWVLVSREDGGALGLMAWLPDPGDPGSAEVGVLLAVGAQGRGHATEAIAAPADGVFSAPVQRPLWTRNARRTGLWAAPQRKAGSHERERVGAGKRGLRGLEHGGQR